jgi:hypothetical protein
MVTPRGATAAAVIVLGFAMAQCAHSRPRARVRADYPALAAALGPDSACASSIQSRVVTQASPAPGFLAASPGGKVYFVRRTDTGEECRLPLGVQPLAYDINGRVFCPDSTPATWTAGDRLERLRLEDVAQLQMDQDSVALRRLRCPVAPLGLVRLRTARAIPREPLE